MKEQEVLDFVWNVCFIQQEAADSHNKSSDDFTLFFLVTILAFIGTFISPVIKWIVKICHKPSSTERQLLKDVNDLKADLNKISMVDEFAKHAKIQRKVNKLTAELEAIQKNNNWSQISITYGAIIGAKVLHAFVVLTVNFKHRYTPVLLVPKELFYPWYPLGFIISFPTGVEGGIGIASWMAISYFVSRRIQESLSK